jgi:hypothetical protein
MAIYKNGILGEFSGTIGAVVGSSWKGIPVIRSKPVRKKAGTTILQDQQRAKFLLMSRFLHPLNGLLNETFQQSAVGMSCFNKAFSENKGAIAGDYPSIGIDYSGIVLSKGRLPLGEPPTISSPESGKLLLTWKTGDGINELLTAGKAFIAAYNEEFNRWIVGQYSITNGSTSCMLEVLPFSGKPVQTYIGFISRRSQKLSQSRYMGSIDVLT